MKVISLDDLDSGMPAGKRLAVLGDPVAHSLSPGMHNAALRAMAEDNPEFRDWSYGALRVSPEELPKALPALHSAGYVGLNLTIPHKVQALDLVESIDHSAQLMGAVNTLVRMDTGYHGTNTDGYGFLKGIESTLGINPEGVDAWLFGAGGAARAIVIALLDAGARRVTVLNRSRQRLEALENNLRGQGLDSEERLRFCGLEEAPMDTAPDALFVNATPLGLKAADPSPIPVPYLLPGTRVYDTTYGTHTQLAEACSARDVAYADGLSMLAWQGACSLEIWTGQAVPADLMLAAASEALQKRNTHG